MIRDIIFYKYFIACKYCQMPAYQIIAYQIIVIGACGFNRWGVLPAIALSQGVLADVVILGIKLDNR